MSIAVNMKLAEVGGHNPQQRNVLQIKIYEVSMSFIW